MASMRPFVSRVGRPGLRLECIKPKNESNRKLWADFTPTQTFFEDEDASQSPFYIHYGAEKNDEKDQQERAAENMGRKHVSFSGDVLAKGEILGNDEPGQTFNSQNKRYSWADYTPTPTASYALLMDPSDSPFGMSSGEDQEANIMQLPFQDDSSANDDGASEKSGICHVPTGESNASTLPSVTSEVTVKNTFIHLPVKVDNGENLSPGLRRRSLSSPLLAQAEPEPLAPAPAGNGLPSVGSEGHADGTCRPCAWFWKPQGCQNGAECRHCHLCPEGEIKRRRKVKYHRQRRTSEVPTSEACTASVSTPEASPKQTSSAMFFAAEASLAEA